MKHILKYTFSTILIVILLLIGGILFLLTSSGKSFVKNQLTDYLSTKLKVPIKIEKLDYDFPNSIKIDGFEIKDQQKSTLIAFKTLYVELDMMAVLDNEIKIKNIESDGLNAHILKQKEYNFDFILNAFADNSSPKTPSEPLKIFLNKINLKNTILTYKDTDSGIDFSLKNGLLKTNLDSLNLDKSLYHLDKFELNNSEISYLKLKTSIHSESEVANFGRQQVANSEKFESLPFIIDFITKNILINDAKIHYEDEESGMKNDLKIAQFQSDFKIKNNQIDVKKVVLDKFENELILSQISKNSNKNPVKTTNQETQNWEVNLNKLEIKNNQLSFNDLATKPIKNGLDYGHLAIKNFNLNLKNLSYKNETIKGKLTQLNFIEKSGFVVNELKSDFEYSPKKINLKNFLFKTPNSTLKNDLSLSFSSIDDLSNNLGKVQIELKANQNSLAINDVLFLAPELAKNPQIKLLKNQVLKFSTSIKGFTNDFNITNLNLSGIGETKINLSGKVKNILSPDNLHNSLNINELQFTKQDISKYISDTLIPKSIEIPNKILIKGQVLGGINDLKINADFLTDFGNLGFKGDLKSITNPNLASYEGIANSSGFDLGKLLKVKSDSIGKITFSTNIKGNGTDPKTMDLRFDAAIQEAFFNQYNYQNLAAKGTFRNQTLDIYSTSNDANLAYEIQSKIDLKDEFPKVNFDLDLKKIDLKKLYFNKDKLIVSAKVKNDLTSTNPNNPIGRIEIPTISIENDSVNIRLDSISLDLANENGLKKINISTQFLNGKLEGNFEYQTLLDAILNATNQYIEIPNLVISKSQNPTFFTFNSTINYHPSLKQFDPKIKGFDNGKIDLKFDNQSPSPIVANLNFPNLKYDTLSINGFNLNINSNSQTIDYQSFINELSYQNFQLRNSELSGNIAQNQINFNYIVRDSTLNKQHGLVGNLALKNKELKVKVDDLTLNYSDWKTTPNGYLSYSDLGVIFNQLELNDGKQKVSLQTFNNQPNAPLKVVLENIDIQGLTNAFLKDTTLAKGKVNCDITLTDYLTNPTFTGDLQIKNLALSGANVGDVIAIASYEGNNKISTYATLENDKDNLVLAGNYDLNSPQPIDYQLIIKKLSDKTIEAFSFGSIKNTKGELFGNINLKGSTDKLLYDGELQIDSLGFKMSSLGSKMLLKNQQLRFNQEKLLFKNFILEDSLKNKMTLNGFVNIAQLPTYSYDLGISGKNFMVMNSTEKDNESYYGKCLIDANLKVKGVEDKYKIDGDVRVDAESKVTFLMSDEVAKQEGQDVVRFIDLNKNITKIQENSSKNEVLKQNKPFDSELALNLETDEKAELKIIVDPLNGDYLKVKGKALLATSINSSGQMTLAGTYEIEDGDYDFSYQVLKKPFKIKKGSKITWTGDPMKGDIELTAFYPVETAPFELIEKDLSDNLVKDAKRKSYFEVLMKMSGNLSKPELVFDIATPENTFQSSQQSNLKDLIDNSLADLRKNDINMNRQVFGLLVLGKFLSDNNSSILAINAESKARESLSKMLSEQLDNFAKDLIKGVNIDLNLISEGQYGTDARTNLNVGLSKGFLNDRLTVSVGRNLELENNTNVQRNSEIFDNYSLNFKITEDGRYALRGYRLNQLQSIIEGYVVETGVSFSIVLEFEGLLKKK